MTDEYHPFYDPTEAQNPAPNVANKPQEPVAPQQPTYSAPQEPAAPQQPAYSAPQEPVAPHQPTYSAPQEPAAPQQPTYSAPQEPAAPQQPTYSAPQEPVAPQQPAYSAPQEPVAPQQPTYSAPQRPLYASEQSAPTRETPTYRPESQYSNYYYYNTSARPQYPQQTAPQPKPAKPPKKKSGSARLGWRVALIAISCAFVGSVVGGGLMGSMVYRHYNTQQDPEVSGLESPTPSTAEPSESIVQTSANQTLLTPALVYERNVDSVVGIVCETTSYSYGFFGSSGTATSSGSGFIITSDGEILTNYHVVEGAQKITVSMSDGSSYEATVLGYEAESDVALLKVDAQGLQAVTLGDSDSLRVGDEIAAIGNPLGELTYTMTVGYVSALERNVSTDSDPISMMQIDAAINSGNSGGPLFDMKGNVVGITSAKYSGSTSSGTTIEGIGFAIPINDVLKILDDLRENGAVLNRAYIGITVTTADDPSGAKIESLTKTGCGYAAGLREGDIITAIGGKAVDGSSALVSALRDYRAGETTTLSVYRNGETLELSITFDVKPSDTDTDTTPSTETPTEQSDNWGFPWNILP